MRYAGGFKVDHEVSAFHALTAIIQNFKITEEEDSHHEEIRVQALTVLYAQD